MRTSIAAFVLGVLSMLAAANSYAAVDLSMFRTIYGGAWTVAQSENAFSIVGRSELRVLNLAQARKLAKVVATAFRVGEVDDGSITRSMGATHFRFIPIVNEKAVHNLDLTVAVDRAGFVISVFGRLEPTAVLPAPPPLPAPGPVPIAAPALELFGRDALDPGVATVVPDLVVQLKLIRQQMCEFKAGSGCFPFPGVPAVPLFSDFEGPFLYALPDRVVNAFRWRLRGPNRLTTSEYVIGEIDGTLRILERRQGYHQFKPAQGRVFDPNPKASTGDLAISHETLSPTGRGRPKRASLVGRYVVVNNNLVPPSRIQVPALVEGSFSENPGTVAFAAGMIYFHVDAMQRYVQSLGFTNLLSCPIEADPQQDGDNSRVFVLDPTKLSMLFGFVGRRFHAEDGDVIAHEYGHALQWGASKAKFSTATHGPPSPQTDAISEGFGDYWAMSYFKGRNRRYRKHDFESECYGEWAVNPDLGQDCMRVVNLRAIRTNFDPDESAHDNGAIWTATLWQLRQLYGRRKTDRLVLESHWFVPDRPGFCTSAMALLAADQALANGARQKELREVFEERRIFGADDCDPVMLP